MSTITSTSRLHVFPTRLLLTFLFLLAAAGGIAMPAVGQDGFPADAEWALSGQAIGAPQPGRRLQVSPPQAGSFRARSGRSGLGLRAHSPDLSGVRWSTGGRVPVLRPVRSGRPLQSRLQTMRQQRVPGARVLQSNARALQRDVRLQSGSDSVSPHRRRWDALEGEVISLRPVSGGLLTGTIGHLADSPSAWDRDTGGYLARVGTSMGSQVVGIGVRHGVSAALDLRLESPEPKGPLLARLGQAALQGLTVRTASGQRVPAVAKTASFYVSNLAQSQVYYGRWKPGEAATTTAIAIGNGIAVSLISELIEAL